jgi:hypothetical protein
VEEVDVASGGGDQWSVASKAVVVTGRVENGGDLESFGMKCEMTWGRLVFIDLKISAAVLVKNRC